MPYIPKFKRHSLDDTPLGDMYFDTPGELNYCVTRLVTRYLACNGESYLTINDCVGALECAKLELYRRVAAPYEDLKIQDNGDVYDT